MKAVLSRRHRIVLLESSLSPAACRAYDAVLRSAGELNWDVHRVEYNIVDRGLRIRQMASEPVVPGLLELWSPDGVIVECAGRPPQIPLEKFGRTPVVLLDCPPACAGDSVCAYTDSDMIAKVAARELLSLGLRHYAYLPYPSATDWSMRRGEAFRQVALSSGRQVRMLKHPAAPQDTAVAVQTLARQLGRLPHPCGVFAANDEMARLLVSACETEGLAVPEDIAAVGVDDDLRFCENAPVTISSVSAGVDEMGENAVRLLAEWIEHGRKPRSVACRSARLVRRLSSTRLAKSDRRVSQALEFIRLNARRGISPLDVAHHLGCSRRYADMRLVAFTGRTLQQEIHRVRIEHVKELLRRRGTPLSAIPEACGYGSMPDLCRDFRKHVGVSMGAWRRTSTSVKE